MQFCIFKKTPALLKFFRLKSEWSQKKISIYKLHYFESNGFLLYVMTCYQKLSYDQNSHRIIRSQCQNFYRVDNDDLAQKYWMISFWGFLEAMSSKLDYYNTIVQILQTLYSISLNSQIWNPIKVQVWYVLIGTVIVFF